MSIVMVRVSCIYGDSAVNIDNAFRVTDLKNAMGKNNENQCSRIVRVVDRFSILNLEVFFHKICEGTCTSHFLLFHSLYRCLILVGLVGRF